MKQRTNEEGFTIVEIGVIVPILLVMVVGMFSVMLTLLLANNADKIRTNLTYNKEQSMSIIEADTTITNHFLSTADTGLADAYAPSATGNAWSFKGDGDDTGSRVLIMRQLSTSDNTFSSTRKPVFQGDPSSSSCTGSSQQGTPAFYNIIYFVQDNTLYRRRLVNRSLVTCLPQYQKQSCPISTSLGSNGCEAYDEVIAQNVSKFNVEYYASPTSTDAFDVYSTGADPTQLDSTRTVDITLTLAQNSGGQSVSVTSEMKITPIN